MSIHAQPDIDDSWRHERRRPAPRSMRWTPADLARRRSLVVARSELEAARDRGDSLSITEAWLSVIDALVEDELVRADPSRAAGGGPVDLDEILRRSPGDELVAELTADDAWSSDPDDEGEDR
jgi:hypothetical protein